MKTPGRQDVSQKLVDAETAAGFLCAAAMP
jgi:hypothetical protein